MQKRILILIIFLIILASVIVAYQIIKSDNAVPEKIPQQNNESQKQDYDLIANQSEDFKLKFGETAYIKDLGIYISFIDLIEDSRCPSNVQCIWEGQAVVLLNIKTDDKNLNETFNLTSRAGHPNLAMKNVKSSSDDIFLYLIILKEVSPYPQVSINEEKQNYVLTLSIEQLKG